MLKFLALLLTLGGCHFTDLLDGDIEDPETCCYLPSADAATECLIDNVAIDDCGRCMLAFFETDYVCKDDDGDVQIVSY